MNKEINWFFNWTSGGYNTVMASSRKDAEAKAKAMSEGLTPDLESLRPDPDFYFTERNRRYYSVD